MWSSGCWLVRCVVQLEWEPGSTLVGCEAENPPTITPPGGPSQDTYSSLFPDLPNDIGGSLMCVGLWTEFEAALPVQVVSSRFTVLHRSFRADGPAWNFFTFARCMVPFIGSLNCSPAHPQRHLSNSSRPTHTACSNLKATI